MTQYPVHGLFMFPCLFIYSVTHLLAFIQWQSYRTYVRHRGLWQTLKCTMQIPLQIDFSCQHLGSVSGEESHPAQGLNPYQQDPDLITD